MNKYVTIGIILVVMLVLSYLLKAAVVVGVIGTLIILAVAFLKKDKKVDEPAKEPTS